MPHRADEQSRVLGGIVCLGAALAGALFLYGLTQESYWALALPVAAVTLFVLGLVFWIGWTIATIRVDAAGEALATTPVASASSSGGGPGSATTPDPAEAQKEPA